MTETVGYIGLGAIGSLMAQRIRQASYPLMVWNRSPDKYGELERMGATVASSPAELAARCPVICICVSDPAAVEHVVFGIDGIAGTAGPQRSEEHTSELQSLMRISYAVFCLKKKKYKEHNTHN